MPLYDIDYGLWLQKQIASLQQHNWEELDIPNLIEELEALLKSNKRELYSYTVVLLAHLLKWQFQKEARSGSWKASITNSRNRIGRLFKDQPSLKNYLPELLQEAYVEARNWVHEETDLDIDIFPTVVRYLVEQLLDQSFLPD